MGTVSHATMRAEDLVPAFTDKLTVLAIEFDRLKEFKELLSECAEMMDKASKDEKIWNSEEMCYLLNEDLFNALNRFSPTGVYFGSHPGDGSDYGFWVCEDFFRDSDGEDILKVSDTSEIAEKRMEVSVGQEILLVDDHGNSTLYRIKGVELEEVWSIV
jgi:hypothetical protein